MMPRTACDRIRPSIRSAATVLRAAGSIPFPGIEVPTRRATCRSGRLTHRSASLDPKASGSHAPDGGWFLPLHESRNEDV